MAKIIIIDDSSLTRRHIEKVISIDGHECIHAQDAEQALEILSEQSVDLLIVDMLMPGMSGDELIKKYREKDSSTPIIVLTADIQDTTQAMCLEIGAQKVLNKPPDTEQLLTTIKSLLAEK